MATSRRCSALLVAMLGTISVLVEAAPKPEPPKDEPARDVVVEKLETTYRFQNDGTGEVITATRWRVLTELGKKAVGQFFFPYSSQLEDLHFDYLRTVKPDGAVVNADVSQTFEVASPMVQAAPMYTDLKYKGLAPAKLEVGDALEVQSTKTIRVPLKPGDFWVIHYPTRGAEVQSEVVVLDTPAGRALRLKSDSATRFSVEEKGGRVLRRWETSNPKPAKASDEPIEPLFAASTLADWKQLGDWYLTLDHSTVTPEIQALAEKLTAGKQMPQEKLEAIYTYVSESIRYISLSFGIGGIQPHPATDVQQNGYGDCKDKHALLASLLAAVGLKAYPVLVDTSRGVAEPDVPVPTQFDHVMSVVPVEGKLEWLDTTLEVAPLGILAESVRGKKAVLLEAGDSRVVEVPELSPVSTVYHTAMTGKLDATGKLSLETRVELRGLVEVPTRQVFRMGNKDVVSGFLKVLAGRQVPDATADNPSSSDPLNLSQPFWFKYQLSDSSFIAPLDKEKEFQIPQVFLRDDLLRLPLAGSAEDESEEEAGSKPDAKPKKKDINLGGPVEIEETLDIEIDPAYKVELPVPIRAGRPFSDYQSTYSYDQGHLRVRRTVSIKVSKISPDHEAEVRSFGRLVTADLGQKVVLKRTGELDIRVQADQMTADDLNAAASKLIDESKDFPLARDLLLKAVAKDPKHKWAWNNLGRAYNDLGQFREAEKALKKQLEINPYDEYAYNNLGRTYLFEKRYDEAIAAVKKQIEISPLDAGSYSLLGSTYGAMKKWDDAAQAYGKAAAIGRDKADRYVSWGEALLKAGKPDEARQNFDRALDLDAGAETLNNVAYFLADAGLDLDKALERARQAVEKAQAPVSEVTSLDVPPEYNGNLMRLGAYLDTLGWVLYRKGEFAKAEPYLLDAYVLSPNSTTAQHVALLYAQQGRPDEALHYYMVSRILVGASDDYAKELQDYLFPKFGGKEGIERRQSEFLDSLANQNRLEPDQFAYTWPADSTSTTPTYVQVAVLVDDNGKVLDKRVQTGDEPFRTAALADVTKLRLPPLTWPGHPPKTVRTVAFIYSPEIKKVTASWGWRTLAAAEGFNFIIGKPDNLHLASVFANLLGGETDNMEMATAVAAAFLREGKADWAIVLLRKALQLNPNSPGAPIVHYDLGLGLKMKKDYDGAVAEFREALRLSPDMSQFYESLAEISAFKGDRSGAIEAYQGLVKLDPNNAESHFNLGLQYEAQGATKNLSGYNLARARKESAHGSAGIRKSALPDYNAALQQYQKAHELAPDNPSYKEAFDRLTRQLKRL